MRVGLPTHFLRIAEQHLNQTFAEQWIERGGPVNWSGRSPDSNSLDFWLWGHLNTFVYSAPINDLQVLQQREYLSGDSSETRNVRQSAQLCATKSSKLYCNAWEPHRASGVHITRTSPISQQALVSGHNNDWDSFLSRAIAQAVSCWLPTAVTQVRTSFWSSRVYGGQSGAGAGFLRVLRFPLPFIPPNSPSSQSPGPGTIGQLVADLPSGPSLDSTPPPPVRIKFKFFGDFS
jgi:hypothetical protein